MGRTSGILDLRIMKVFVCVAVVVLLHVPGTVNGYKIGVGRADCTGPSVEVIFVSIIWM